MSLLHPQTFSKWIYYHIVPYFPLQYTIIGSRHLQTATIFPDRASSMLHSVFTDSSYQFFLGFSIFARNDAFSIFDTFRILAFWIVFAIYIVSHKRQCRVGEISSCDFASVSSYCNFEFASLSTRSSLLYLPVSIFDAIFFFQIHFHLTRFCGLQGFLNSYRDFRDLLSQVFHR